MIFLRVLKAQPDNGGFFAGLAGDVESFYVG